MTNKKELREKYKHFNKSFCSSCTVEKIKQSKEYVNAKNIMIFYPLENEVNLLALLKDCSKNFYLPKIDGENLLCCPYTDGEELCLSKFKTKEPLTEPCDKANIDLVIVPALACDKQNYRLGYGGGFYDRFLKDYKGTKICCIPKNLVLETVYPEQQDVKMDLIITD